MLSEINSRINWYGTAIAMHTGAIESSKNFTWPPSSAGPYDPMSLYEWRGALRELKLLAEYRGKEEGGI